MTAPANTITREQLPSQTEAQFQAAVMDFARVHHWRVVHFHDSRREVVNKHGERKIIGDEDARGWPDLVLLRPPQMKFRPPHMLFVELKREKGRLRKEQDEMLQMLWACGGEIKVWRPSDWPAIEEVLM